jgi:hypothetical protein
MLPLFGPPDKRFSTVFKMGQLGNVVENKILIVSTLLSPISLARFSFHIYEQ